MVLGGLGEPMQMAASRYPAWERLKSHSCSAGRTLCGLARGLRRLGALGRRAGQLAFIALLTWSGITGFRKRLLA